MGKECSVNLEVKGNKIHWERQVGGQAMALRMNGDKNMLCLYEEGDKGQ